MMSLAADIGGTYSRLAWTCNGTVTEDAEQRFDNSDFVSLEALIDHALSLRGDSGQAIDRMVTDAKALGANAIVDTRFSTSYLMGMASEILAYGTAVIIEDE